MSKQLLVPASCTIALVFISREVRQETPSHTGGVSEEAIRRREEERRKRDERGITYNSRDKRNEGRDNLEQEWKPRGRDRKEDTREGRDR
jgi:pre-mRNA-splicing factor ATP-dependent RNA helicase DHX38/PRP16